MTRDPGCFCAVADGVLDGAAQLVLGDIRRVGLEDARLAFTISARAQKVAPSP